MPLFRRKIDDLTCQDRLGTKRCRIGKETSHTKDGVSTQEEEPIADEEPEFERLLEAALACGHESESGIKCIRRRVEGARHALPLGWFLDELGLELAAEQSAADAIREAEARAEAEREAEKKAAAAAAAIDNEHEGEGLNTESILRKALVRVEPEVEVEAEAEAEAAAEAAAEPGPVLELELELELQE
eukprot:COSAG06_NODE_339_length_17218_cov_1405.741866_8_plen_188_part_00